MATLTQSPVLQRVVSTALAATLPGSPGSSAHIPRPTLPTEPAVATASAGASGLNMLMSSVYAVLSEDEWRQKELVYFPDIDVPLPRPAWMQRQEERRQAALLQQALLVVQKRSHTLLRNSSYTAPSRVAQPGLDREPASLALQSPPPRAAQKRQRDESPQSAITSAPPPASVHAPTPVSRCGGGLDVQQKRPATLPRTPPLPFSIVPPASRQSRAPATACTIETPPPPEKAASSTASKRQKAETVVGRPASSPATTASIGPRRSTDPSPSTSISAKVPTQTPPVAVKTQLPNVANVASTVFVVLERVRVADVASTRSPKVVALPRSPKVVARLVERDGKAVPVVLKATRATKISNDDVGSVLSPFFAAPKPPTAVASSSPPAKRLLPPVPLFRD